MGRPGSRCFPPRVRARVQDRDASRLASRLAVPQRIGSDGIVMGLDRFGASAPYERIYEELGLSVDKLVDAAERVVAEAVV